MKKEQFSQKLISFLEESSCSFTCVKEIRKQLLEHGFVEFFEQDSWQKEQKFFIVRNDASIIAFEMPETKNDIFSIITTHLDTPALFFKPSGANVKDGYLKMNVMPYGGILNYGWLDHPLAIAGRVMTMKNHHLKKQIIDFKKPMLIVPSVAIHQNDQANSNLDLNMQVDLQPILSLSKNTDDWNTLLKEAVKDEIIDYDLFAYNPMKPTILGKNILVSPRIDNITSVHASLQSFLESKSNSIKVFCSFNNEEIGSLTQEGADSSFLLDSLKRVAALFDIDIASSLAKSMIISSDNTHAIHPNHPEYSDNTGTLHLGDGFAIIKEINSTTNAVSSSILKTLCKKHKIKYQDSTSKNDIAGGSTLSGISLRHVSALSIDVGIPQLAMHSSIETCCTDDVFELYKMMCAFYGTTFQIKKDQITFLE